MDDLRDLGVFLMMLAVLPLFLAVFLTALIVLSPILMPMWAWGRRYAPS